jgi:hypothetical protein
MTFTTTNSTMRSYFNGSRRSINVVWAIIVSLGGLGFFLNGLSSFFEINVFFYLNSGEITFIPQGITMLFYGTLGFLLGIFITLTIYWDVGYGYNEYNKDRQEIKLYRKGFPGKNRELLFIFSFENVKSIKMRVQEGINPKRQLLLCLLDSREIPLTIIEQPMALNKFEGEAIKLAKYLNVFLETE